MKTIPIERKKSPSPEEFARDFLQGDGKPVILTDAIDQWPARSKWTFEFLRAAYGSDFVSVSRGILSVAARKLTKLASFIDHLDTPSEELPGFWIDADGKPLHSPPAPSALPHYLLGWYALLRHPELWEDIRPAPSFVADWTLALDPALMEMVEWTTRKEFTSIYVGPAGTLSRLHQDFGQTHSYLAQIRGSKRVLLFSPKDSALLYNGEVDPEQPDREEFPRFDQATAYEGVIGPGDLLFTPPDWWHYVRALEKSITVSHNFFNDINYNQHLSQLFSNVPRLVCGLDQHPEWRDRLGIDWDTSRFTTRDG